MSKKNFLVEIGTEELPPKNLRNIAKSFATNFTVELSNIGLTHGNVEWFATPRRLALKVENIAAFQSDFEIKRRGPAISKAFNTDGKPSKAAESWARSCGITVDQAKRVTTDKGEWLFYNTYIKGKRVEVLLPKIVTKSLANLPILKLMRWGEGNTCFIRPVYTITLLLNEKVIPANIFGIHSDRIICGHHFMGESEFTIDSANQYPGILLERGKVIANYETRKAKIKADIEKAAYKIGGIADINEFLLEEITSLVEWPIVLTAKFETEFLDIPIEVITFIMKNNQKYFPVYTTDGKLLPNFIFVANIESSEPQRIISGNEKVIRSLLEDAKFFFNTDRKKRLEDNLPCLKSILFQQKLGTMYDKTNRIVKLSGWIAREVGADVKKTVRAGLLSKCDLMTNMVFEFTEIQGTVGMNYARYDGELEDVAIAINEQYQPRFSGDQLPSSLISCAVAIADKIDTLTGIFGINQPPKGNKDPFSLRRAALGVLRILVEKNLNLDLQTLIKEAVCLYEDKLTNTNVVDEVINFMLERLKAWYQSKGYSISNIQAVLARRPTCPVDFNARVKAVSHFCTLEGSSALIVINKRISNILAKSKETLNDVIYSSLLKENAEIELASSLDILRDKLQLYLAEGKYQEALTELVSLRIIIDNFFENVMVNTDNKEVRINRLTLLFNLRELFLQLADISLLQ